MNRRRLILLLGGVVFAPRALRAQQKAMPVIGYLSPGSPGAAAPYVAAFRQGLSETGYDEGRNVAIEYRWAEGHYDRLPALAADLVSRQVDVIAAGGGSVGILAAKSATSTIPIVFFGGGDVVGLGFVTTLARPGGNLTGFTIMGGRAPAEAARSAGPNGSPGRRDRLTGEPEQSNQRAHDTRHAASGSREGGGVPCPEGRRRGRFRGRFRKSRRTACRRARHRCDPFFNSRREELVALAARHAVPAIYEWREFAELGGLISYGPSATGIYRQVGAYVGRVLAGEKPADLPVQQPTTFELVVNLKTAKALSIALPPSILARADEVIE